MIYIHKGDDTNFNNSSFLKFELITENDLNSWKALFNINTIKREINDISSKNFEINLTKEETDKLNIGKTKNELILIDQNGRIKTVIKDLDIVVTTDVVNNPHQTINVPILKEDGIDINIKVSNAEGVGTTNHNELENRNIPNQHTISAITNLREELNAKQPLISDLDKIRANSSSALQEHQDISHLATKKELEAKQDLISDLEEIRTNATNAVKDVSNLATKAELNSKQDVLASGVNIKTINNQSILGEGNIEIQGGSSINLKDIEPYIDGQWVPHRAYLLNTDTLAVNQTHTIDVSEIVPYDEYDYEVLLFLYAYPKNNKATIKCIIWMSTDYLGVENHFLPVRIENPMEMSYGLTQGATFTVPIGSKRELYISPTASDTGSVHLGINGYRRLGKAIPNK